ncbi:MAG: acyltransferase [Dyadobacter sp.]|uniref:acyltransferase family protein n=1 Tax=Dyadobacter sp. TaxID=1914288 RepID=UPI0032634724
MDVSRIKFLDGFRFILALWVVGGHFYDHIGGPKTYKLPEFFLMTLNKPIIAVYGFMIITGFLMMYNYLARQKSEPPNSRETIIKFWLRRLFRLYPVYIIMIVIAFFTFVKVTQIDQQNLVFFTGSNVTQWGFARSAAQPGIADLISHIFLIHGLFPGFHDSILGVAWSLSLEMQFYFLFPFLFLFIFAKKSLQRKRLVLFLILSVLLALVSPKILYILTNLTSFPAFRLPSVLTVTLPLFLFGMTSAGVKLGRISPVYLCISLFLLLPFQLFVTNAITALFLLFLFLDELRPAFPDFLFKILAFFRSLLSGKIAGYGADISYSLYLVHPLLMGLIVHQTIFYSKAFNLSKLSISLIALFLILLTCFTLCNLIYRFIEKPLIGIGKKIVDQIAVKQPDELNVVK